MAGQPVTWLPDVALATMTVLVPVPLESELLRLLFKTKGGRIPRLTKRVRWREKRENYCFRCGEVGHFVVDCTLSCVIIASSRIIKLMVVHFSLCLNRGS